MSELVIFAAVVGTAVVIAWFLTGRSAADLEGREASLDPRWRDRPERSTFGPAGPGAEIMDPDRATSSQPDSRRSWR